MARSRLVVAGAGAVGASIAYHLALRGARRASCSPTSATIASGATGKAMGGVRQQFSTAPEVRLARESVRVLPRRSARELFEQVGYLFLATTRGGARRARAARARCRRALGVPVERVDPSRVDGLARRRRARRRVLRARTGRPTRRASRASSCGAPSELGVEVREQTDALELDADVLVARDGRGVGGARGEARRRAARPAARPPARRDRRRRRPPARPAADDRVASRAFHFRRARRRARARDARADVRAGATSEAVDEALVEDWLAPRSRGGYPPAAGAPVARAWAGLYDMTPDAHPIVGEVADGLYAACGFSGHGFMQAPAVGRHRRRRAPRRDPGFDLAPYRLERFAGGRRVPGDGDPVADLDPSWGY